ncbi:MAG: Bax inhibitor-1/YccA family protein [Alphaproteobacteria bacterium]|nr:Bax inhibitor-1/YccA family protein [Alphaproteobacteria bacterium]MBV9694690.1 Bax inhibitor-1/YccA family protein [Alphaproteobacteria bacterium]
MADYDNRALRARTGVAAGAIDAGLRAYMLRVYNYMFIGLVLTGVAAYATYAASVVDTGHGLMLTDLGRMLFVSPLKFVVIFAPLAVVLMLSFGINRIGAPTAQIMFWVYSGLVGISLGSIFLVYAGTSIAQVFFITAAAFGGLSLWGYTTKSDLTGFGSFLIMGLVGIIIAMVVNMFLHSSTMAWVVSVLGVGIFAGLTAYDTQKIKEMYYAGDDGALAAKKSIMGALALYLDFLNIFLFLLQLMGAQRR